MMSKKPLHIIFDEIDLDEIDINKLTPEQHARLLRAKGIAGKGDYTKERREWQEALSDEQIKKIDEELLRMSGGPEGRAT